MGVLAGFAVVAAVLAAWAPLPLSFASVWLFAGPHNWMEARYFLARLPRRWVVRREFFVLAVAGILVLGVAFASASPHPLWFTGLGLWVLALVRLAGRDAGLAAGPVLAAIALAWWNLPGACLALLYLHPLAALWFVYRQAGKRWPDRARWPYLAVIVGLGMLVMAVRWGSVGPMGQWSRQALTALPADPPLVALHAYLELVHYGAWVLALPLIGMAARPWEWRNIPLARRWPGAVRAVLGIGMLAMLVLWAGLGIDYDKARGIYFTVAIFHVLAEAPMLIWLR